MRYAFINITKFTFLFSAFLFFIFGCKKEEETFDNPSIELITDMGYTTEARTFLLGDTLQIGFTAQSNSDVSLTHFNIEIEKDSQIISIDSGIYDNQFRYEKRIIKGLARNEKWSFYATDRDGRKSDILSVEFMLDSASIFGSIQSTPSIIMGAQNNTQIGSFYSFSNNNVYTLDQAFLNQSSINLLYFYDLFDGENNSIASPGASLDVSVYPADKAPAIWEDKNTTRFVYQENLGPVDFDNCKNDSLILSNSFEFSRGKRKAKKLAKDQVYSFETDQGLKGLFKVLELNAAESGTINIAIKTQDNE